MMTMNFRGFARKSLLALALVTVFGGAAAAPALADDGWHRGDRDRHEDWRRAEWRHEEWRREEWREHHRYYEPHYAYATPYYAPGYAYAPPALNFVIPLNIR